MPSIDDRIVQMQFDNALFERRIATTMQSLDKLNQVLANAGQNNGLDKVDKAFKTSNLDGMTSAVDALSKKFILLSTVAVAALATIVSKAVTAGGQIVKSLSIEPVLSGFREYELQIGSIQTILANTSSKGTTLSQVSQALDKLNEYSDRTIYNFSEMTRNIGTFTAAGVDLDTSVQSIKGIANIAAISGSSSQQASLAMYQLSQAIATGTVKLIDWNSVVNAGMGGEVFQKALFETGKALKTIPNIPIGTTFEEWTKNGNSFRGSLETGWLTAEVLTTTLQGFTGEMTEAQLTALGYTKEQAAEMIRLGKLGVDSATKVRTLSQLFSTTKEAISSGWAQTFKIIFGDFNQATELFTGISNALGGIIGKAAEARNGVLEGWASLGGREELINGLKNIGKSFADVFGSIRDAFRDIFPPLTAERLLSITKSFSKFAQTLRPSEETLDKLGRIFKGLFSTLEIGWEVIKNGAKFFANFFKEIGLGSGKFLSFAAKIGDFFTDLNTRLIDGGALVSFFKRFESIGTVVAETLSFAGKIIKNFFSGLSTGSFSATGLFSGFVDHLKDLKNALGDFSGFWDPIKNAFKNVGKTLAPAWERVKSWFKDLGSKLSEVLGPNEFNNAVDAINVGMLGSIILLLRKFTKEGLKFGFNFNGVSSIFENLTDTLSAMQSQIKASAILKIAAAVGILAASVLLLSSIDSKAMSRSLGALAVSFGQLIGAFVLMNQLVSGFGTVTQMTILATAMGILSGAILILTVAVKNLSTLSWNDTVKGLGSVLVLLGGLSAASLVLSRVSGTFVKTGIGLLIISMALRSVALAVKSFGSISWGELAKGLVGVSVSLAVLVAAVKAMPQTTLAQAVSVSVLGVSLSILASALKKLGAISWGQLLRGISAMGVSLVAIALAMRLMPSNVGKSALSILVISSAVSILAKAVNNFGNIPLKDLAKGLASLAISMGLLIISVKAVSGSSVSAFGIAAMAVALASLAQTVKLFGSLKISSLVQGLIGLAASLAIIGAAAVLLAPTAPALLALGAAMLLLSGSFALFGAGAALFAKAIETIAKTGKIAIEIIGQLLDVFISKLPQLGSGIGKALVELVDSVAKSAPALAKALGIIIDELLTTAIQLIPKLSELISKLISAVLTIIVNKAPEFVNAGAKIILALLQGIKDNIGEITQLAVDIIIKFVDKLAENAGLLADAATGLIVSFVNGITSNINTLALSGTAIVIALVGAIVGSISKVVSAAVTIVVTFIAELGKSAGKLFGAGIKVLTDFLNGIASNMFKVINAVTQIVTTFITSAGANASKLITAGAKVLTDLLSGISNNLSKVTTTVATVIATFISSVGKNAQKVVTAGVDTVIAFIKGLGQNALKIANAAADVVIDFINGLARAISQKSGELREAGKKLAFAIVDGATLGLASKAKGLISKVTSIFSSSVEGAVGELQIRSPSKVFMKIGQNMMLGAILGVERNDTLSKTVVKSIKNMISDSKEAAGKFGKTFEIIDGYSPTITPVLDFSKIVAGSKTITDMLAHPTLTSELSYAQAKDIYKNMQTSMDVDPTVKAAGDVRFEQNIYAPSQLSTGEIYRQTKNQIKLAKEELSIP